MSAFNEQSFESKLINLKDSQESINLLSSWCLQNRDHHKKIVNCWLHCLKRVKIDQRLSLFYLANDVIQYSKRKHYQFVESWGTALQKATTLVRDEKVKNRILRIFKIWEERGVYDESFISDLCGLLSTNVRKKTELTNDPADFQASILVQKIKECQRLETETDLRFKRVKENKLPLTDADSMRMSLKDRRQGTDIVAEVEQGVKKMEAYVKSLENEIRDREKLIVMLHQGSLFYETQRGEAKIVSNAYRNFGNKVKVLKKKLDEMLPTFVDSPVPSPDVNAPSPSPDSDIELPSDDKKNKTNNYPLSVNDSNNGLDFSFMNSNSFIGSSQILLDMQGDVFNRDNSHDRQPIKVLNTRSDNPDFNITDFIKTLIPENVNKLDIPPPPPPPLPPTQGEPLLPPPIPPVFTHDVAFVTNAWQSDLNKPAWSEADKLPGWTLSQPPQDMAVWEINQEQNDTGWSQHHEVLETPESPPLYERSGPLGQEPVEYDDTAVLPPVPDVDHRTLLQITPQDMDHRLSQDMDHRLEQHASVDIDHRPKDIDHRNLISLTGSPGSDNKPPLRPPPEFIWPPQERDRDYRNVRGSKCLDIDFRLPPPPPSHKQNETEGVRKDSNVESVDMDVSEDDDDPAHQAAGESAGDKGFNKAKDDADGRLKMFGRDNNLGPKITNDNGPDNVTNPDNDSLYPGYDDNVNIHERNGVYDDLDHEHAVNMFEPNRFRWSNNHQQQQLRPPPPPPPQYRGRPQRFPHPRAIVPSPGRPGGPRHMFRNFRPRIPARGRW